MFKFKMLTKVLVAVFFYGSIIETNLNLSIALSIDLDRPASSVKLYKTWQANSKPSGSSAPDSNSDADDFTQEPGLASQTAASTLVVARQGDDRTELEVASASATSSSTGSRAVQTLESNGRLNYFGRIHVGSERTPFMVLFDLTSSAFWLPSSECKSLLCLSRQKYNGVLSSSHEEDGRTLELAYGHDKREGAGSGDGDTDSSRWATRATTRLVRDDIVFAGLTIRNQTFGEALELEGEQLKYMPVDGFLGMGFKQLISDSAENQLEAAVETPFEQLLRRGLLKEPIFSLLIKADVAEFNYSADCGELILGELAAGYQQEELTYVPVTHLDYWEFHLGSVSLRHTYDELERACESACPAILDTSTPFISGHYTDVDRLNRAMGAYPEGDGIYRLAQCDLSLLPHLVLSIGDVDFSLAPDDYIIRHEINGAVVACYSALRVVQADQYPFWILGENFLKRHYVVFDYGRRRLGFARSKSMVMETEVDIYGRQRRKRPIV